MTKVLITGINGLIGQILAKSLNSKYQILGLDSRSPFSKTIFPVDIGDRGELQKLAKRLPKITYLVHLAAASDPHAPAKIVFKNNVFGAKNVYDLARGLGVKRVIFASSQHVFRPITWYALSKIFGELLAAFYWQRYHLPSKVLRIGSVTRDNKAASSDNPKIFISHQELVTLFRHSLETPAGD